MAIGKGERAFIVIVLLSSPGIFLLCYIKALERWDEHWCQYTLQVVDSELYILCNIREFGSILLT